jgi:nucleoside-diphosphate-sugar epimerase
VRLVRGDIGEPSSLSAACEGVELVFHAAGMPEQWQRDPSVFDRVNRQGTRNVMDAARAAGVGRVVYTSTMDVFAAAPGGTLLETNIDPEPKPTDYERSKQAAEREAEAVRAQGLDVVYTNPCAVYGPSPVNLALNAFFITVLTGKAPVLPPGGMSIVYVDGCAEGHLAAAERGRSGERYLLADAHLSTRELAEAAVRAAGKGTVPWIAPAFLLRALAAVSAPLARTFGFKPLISPGELSVLLWDARVDATKARTELGFVPTPPDFGVQRTVAFLREQGLVPA